MEMEGLGERNGGGGGCYFSPARAFRLWIGRRVHPVVNGLVPLMLPSSWACLFEVIRLM